MPTIAKGTVSYLAACPIAAFGANPLTGTGAYTTGGFVVPFSSESLVEQINSIPSTDIRRGRSSQIPRGGNMSAGGQFSQDFSPFRSNLFLEHLFGSKTETYLVTATRVGSPATQVLIPALTASTFVRGDFVKDHGKIYVCSLGGAVTSPEAITGLTHTMGTHDLSASAFDYFGEATADAVVLKTVYKGADSLPASSFVMEKVIKGASADKSILIGSCRVDGLGLTLPQEGMARADWNILGMRTANQAGAFIANPSQSPVQDIAAIEPASGATSEFYDTPFVGREASLRLSFNEGTTFGESRPVREGSFNIANAIDPNTFAWGSRYRYDSPEGIRAVTANFSVYFKDSVEYDAWSSEAPMYVLLDMIHGGSMIVLRMPEAYITGTGTPSISGPGVLMSQYSLQAAFGNNSLGVDAQMETYVYGELTIP